MYLVNAIHPTNGTPRAVLCFTAERAAAEAKKFTDMIGDDIANSSLGGVPAVNPHWIDRWHAVRGRGWEEAIAFLKADYDADECELDVWIDEMQPVDEPAVIIPSIADHIDPEGLGAFIKENITEPMRKAIKAGAPVTAELGAEFAAGMGFANYGITSRELKLHNALKTAHSHLTAMASFISDVNKGRQIGNYSFEALGEDEWMIRDAIAAVPISHHIEQRLKVLASLLGAREPLPTALAMIDMIVGMEGEAGKLARYARIALSKIIAAGTEVHANLGAAIETHIYDFDNGDEIDEGCAYHAAMKKWADAMVGDPGTYAAPANPLPWSVVVLDALVAGDPPRYLHIIAADGREVLSTKSPTDEEYRDFVAAVSAINAQPLLGLAAV